MTGKIIQRGSGSSNRSSMSLLKRTRSLLKIGACGGGPRSRFFDLGNISTQSQQTKSLSRNLVDGSLREVVAVRLQVQRAEGLFVLGEILAENVPECLGLLRAQKDGRVIADGDLFGGLAGSQSEDELEIPQDRKST